MLLNLLTKEEKYYFLDLLSKVINADGPATDYDKIVFEMFLIFHNGNLACREAVGDCFIVIARA